VTAKAIWNLALACAGLVYLVLVFFRGIESPLFVAAFTIVAGGELIRSHRPGPPP
jgi:hypothetical protein